MSSPQPSIVKFPKATRHLNHQRISRSMPLLQTPTCLHSSSEHAKYKEQTIEQPEMMFSFSALATRALRRLQQTPEAKQSTRREVGWRWIFWQTQGGNQTMTSGKKTPIVSSSRRQTGSDEDTTTIGPWYNW
jgi:hypothetical protein